jgi:hypothetical protein
MQKLAKVSGKQLSIVWFGFLGLALLCISVLNQGALYAITPPVLKWSKSIPGHIVQSSPSSVDLDGGTKDIVVGAWDAKVYGLRGEDGNAVTGWPAQTAKPIDSSAAAADVNGDNKPEIFIGSGDPSSTCAGGGMYSFNQNGSQRFHFKADDLVSTGGSKPCPDLAIHGSPALADLNFDNDTDVVFGALGVRTWMLNSNGALSYGWPFHWDDTQFASPALGDINNDGKVDIVMGGDASLGGVVNFRGGLVRAISGTGRELWQYRIGEQVYSSPAIGDVDGDGHPEIVFGAGNFWANNGGSPDSNKVFVLSETGRLKWSRDLGAQTLASPALADFNGDGVLDIGIGTWNGTNAGKIYAMRGTNGSDLTGYPRASGGNLVIGQLSTADLDNDGGQDIVTATGSGAYAYSGKTGALLFTLKGFGSFQNSPLIEDLDGNGLLDIVIAGSPDNVTGVVERYEMPSGSTATLGSNGWPKFRKDAQQTGSWLAAPLKNPNAANPRSQLTADQTIQADDYIMSPNGQSVLHVETNGNLVLYRNFNNVPWSSHSSGTPLQLVMQADGNLVLYNTGGGPIWYTGTGGNPGAKLVMQDDGNMVLYSSGGAVLWSSASPVPNYQTYVNDGQYGGEMYAFQKIQSADGRYTLTMQKDGNLVLYSPNRALWQSGTSNHPLSRLAIQPDGNMVVYDTNRRPAWYTGTNQRDKLILQNDGNLVLYNGRNQPLWATLTNGQL